MKLTATGKVKRRHAGAGHLMSGKNAKRRRRVTGSAILTGAMAKKIKARLAT
jgi:large subunit ribosomal protein L35